MNRRETIAIIPILVSMMFLLARILTCAGFARAGNIDPDHPVFLPFIANDFNAGWNWSKLVTTTLTPRPNHLPLMVLDRSGNIHVFWDTLSSPQYIYHTFWNGQGWSTISPVASTFGAATTIEPPFISADGRLHLVWRVYLGSSQTNPYRLFYAAFDGSKWSNPEELFQSTDSYIFGVIYSGATDGFHALILNNHIVSPDIYDMTRTVSSWSSPTVIDPVHLVDSAWPDSAGGIHIFGQTFNPQTLYYSYWLNGQFAVSGRHGSGTLSNYPNHLDGSKNLHLFHTGSVPIPGGTVTGVFHQCIDTNLSWGPQEFPSSQMAITSNLVHAGDMGSQFALAWKEQKSGRIQIGLWNGCASMGRQPAPIPSATQWEVESLAIDSAANQICVLVNEWLTSRYAVTCVSVSNSPPSPGVQSIPWIPPREN